MFHQHIPIRRDHELCCGSCGLVLENISDPLFETQVSVPNNFAYPGLDTMLIGTSFSKIGFWQHPDNRDLLNKERVGKKLVDICKEFHISERIAYETMRRMLKENRGFYSTHKQIRALSQVLRDTQTLRYILLIPKIRDKYDKIPSGT